MLTPLISVPPLLRKAIVMTSPTFLRFQLGRQLRRLREDAGLTAEEVGTEVDCSGSTIRRIEAGGVGIKRPALLQMLSLYKVTDDHRDTLVALAKQGTQRGWWARHRDLPTAYGQFVGLEPAANQVRKYEALLVPGLLQTEEYARAVILGCRPQESVEGVDLRVKIRMERQVALNRDNPLHLWAIFDEAVLHRHVGGAQVMADQLDHLLAVASRRNVTIQVLPYSVGSYAGMAEPFAILAFDELSDMVYVEGLTGDLYMDDDEVARYMLVFDHLRAAALNPNESVKLIRDARAHLPR